MTGSSLQPPAVSAWALRLPRALAAALAPLRLTTGVEIGEDGAHLWLRGRIADDALAVILRGLPAEVRYAWLDDGRLRVPGAWLAAARLPALRWMALREWWSMSLPVARLPAQAPPPVSLALVAGGAERAPGALLVELAAWLDWMRTAPELRLARLRFAVQRATRQALVVGTPLPPLPGRAAVVDEGVIVPAGWSWRPAVSAAAVRRVLGAPAQAMVWWDEAGARVLGAELWVPASRAAARATHVTLFADREDPA